MSRAAKEGEPGREPVQGLVLVVGPDGAGKSTLVAELAALADANHVRLRQDHFRPGVLRPPSENKAPVMRPHAQPSHRALPAVLKLGFVFADTVLGSAGVWRKARRRGIAVVERGWYDMAVDPRRYRLPDWVRPVIRLAGRLLPRADLVVLLSGDPQVMHARKPEIGVHEVSRQLDEWRAIAGGTAHRVVELDSVDVRASTQAKKLWDDLRAPVDRPTWRKVPFGSRRLDLHVAGRVTRTAWVHRSYRPTPRLVDPLRPPLARFGRRTRRVDRPLETVPHLCRLMGIRPSGYLAMRSSTKGRWVVGIAAGDRLVAVAKIGSLEDESLHAEATVLGALGEGGPPRWIPELLWSGELEGTFAMATRAIDVDRRAVPSLLDTSDFCTELVRGTSRRPPMIHGDLTPWNVVCTARGICVLDWEHAISRRRPLHDLAHCVIQSGALLHHYSPREVVALLTLPGSPGWKHLEACEIDPRTGRELLWLYLAEAPKFAIASAHFREQVARWLC